MTPRRPSLRLATRGSPLALAQARQLAEKLASSGGGRIDTELVVVETAGDRATKAPIHAIGGQGVFVKEVELAVLEGRAEVAVHSAKDLPSSEEGGEMLSILAVLERADARDALVGRSLDDLAVGASVATGSVRRRAQLAWLRPDLVFTELRGNIGTRLGKIPSGGAVVVAQAALDRLGRGDEAAETLSPTRMLPQVGQGTIAVTGRADDSASREALARIEHLDTRQALEAERAFLAEVGGGCQLPVGGYATRASDGRLCLEVMLASLDGHRMVRAAGSGDDPVALGRLLAHRLLHDCGGAQLLDEVAPAVTR